jgi:hypothetical protein
MCQICYLCENNSRFGWTGFKPVLQKCLFSAPFFLAEGREGRIRRPFPFIDIFWLRETISPDVLPPTNRRRARSRRPDDSAKSRGVDDARVRVEIIKERYSFGLTPIPSGAWRSPPVEKEAWEHERRTLAGAVASIAFQSQPEYVGDQIRKKLKGEIYAAYRMGFSKSTPGYSKRRPAKRAILRRYRIRKPPQGSGRVSKP